MLYLWSQKIYTTNQIDKNPYTIFIDLEKAFDTIVCKSLINTQALRTTRHP